MPDIPADDDGLQPRPPIFPSAEKGAEEFTGRDAILRQIVEWIDKGSERFFLLLAEPGWGKSSLCAWMIGPGLAPDTPAERERLGRLRKTWSAGYLCSATTGSTINPDTFVETIASQLAARVDGFGTAFLEREAPGQFTSTVSTGAVSAGSQVTGILIKELVLQTDDPRNGYERAVRRPLAAIDAADDLRGTAGDQRSPVFILVDGLDDALTFSRPNILDLIAESTDFPPRVRFFLTSRREENVLGALPLENDVRLAEVSKPEFDAANDADIRTYVATRAAQPNIAAWAERSGLGRDRFVDELVRQADGNFLFIRFVLDNPPPAGAAMASIPVGLAAAYEGFLARLVPGAGQLGNDEGWSKTVKPVLGALTVAVPAAPVADIPLWLEAAPDVPAGLTRVGQVTEFVPDDGGSRRLYHRSLADFLSSETLAPLGGEPRQNRFYVEPPASHAAIVAYYESAIKDDWNGDWRQCDGYGLRRLVPHLYALHAVARGGAKRQLADRICDLALDKGFQDAQRQNLGDGSATIEAIRLALDVASETRDPDAIRKRVREVASSWEPEMRAFASRTLAKLSKTDPNAAIDELKALLR
jgi:hypothetical protein